ncbi:MAG: ankyrin repeat domain-containing protein [Rhodoferax sp.]|uniref:ankyrin repeat domain-containing protein n=1 Tax=Rhodoferax sp. TaxID=50421 RepID=UPI00262E7A80|nr:ankyrin repeat domain-containing protein [Rhodoferax sp.]MDD2882387.1 ankyrin repeat domain-containing protein [Rhodoferax sp.]
MKSSLINLINHFKKVIYLLVLTCFSVSHAGSYDDFFSAIERDDAAKVSELLLRGFDPNTVDAAGTAGLLLAVKSGALNVALVLAKSPKTKVEVRNAADESPLMLAALKGETALCQLLIRQGADVNKPGWAPLHYAATNGHLEAMNLLLEENAYIDAASPNGTTPLMMAALYGTESAVKLLLEAGADPLLKNSQGLSALDFANRGNRTDSANIISAFVRGLQPKGTW